MAVTAAAAVAVCSGSTQGVAVKPRPICNVRQASACRHRGEHLGSEPHQSDKALDGLADRRVIVDHSNQGDLGHGRLSGLPKLLPDFLGRHHG